VADEDFLKVALLLAEAMHGERVEQFVGKTQPAGMWAGISMDGRHFPPEGKARAARSSDRNARENAQRPHSAAQRKSPAIWFARIPGCVCSGYARSGFDQQKLRRAIQCSKIRRIGAPAGGQKWDARRTRVVISESRGSGWL